MVHVYTVGGYLELTDLLADTLLIGINGNIY